MFLIIIIMIVCLRKGELIASLTFFLFTYQKKPTITIFFLYIEKQLFDSVSIDNSYDSFDLDLFAL